MVTSISPGTDFGMWSLIHPFLIVQSRYNSVAAGRSGLGSRVARLRP